MGYNLYLAQVIGAFTDTDSRIQVKILPQMENMTSAMCPRWPCFFRDEGFTGKGGELVWVICNDDFSLGYVLGLANYTTYTEDTYSDYSIPADLKEVGKNITLDLKAETLQYTNIKIEYWDDNCIHFIEKSTGGKIIVFNTGTIYIMRPKEFIVKIGETKFSMNASGVSMFGENINIGGKYIGLGENPSTNVVGTMGARSDGASPSSSVMV